MVTDVKGEVNPAIAGYIEAAMKRAHYKILEDDGSFFGEVPEIEGAWGNAATLEECREDLKEAVEGWLLVSLQHRLPIPTLNGIQ